MALVQIPFILLKQERLGRHAGTITAVESEDDEVEIAEAARRRLQPWFDDASSFEQWVVEQLLCAADELRMHRDPPGDWPDQLPSKRRRESLRFIESVGRGPDAVLLFDCRPERVLLRAAITRSVKVTLTHHARERMHERMDLLEPDAERQRRWLDATVDIALRNDLLTLEAPKWAASAPLKPGLGWTTRRLGRDEIALLVAAPHHDGGPWNIVTVLTRSTAFSLLDRVRRLWTRRRRRRANERRHGTPEPVRAQALRPPTFGDIAPPPPRTHGQRRRRRPS